MNIILLGAPGCGKGTYSKLLKSDFGFDIFSTGDILRETEKLDTPIGKKLRTMLGTGNLVPDEMVNDIIKYKIDGKSNFILDGYPRTIEQAEFLSTITKIDKVIYLHVSENELIKRILNRGKTSGRKDDSDISIIKHRLAVFQQETLPLKKFYNDIIVSISNEGSIDDVYLQIVKSLQINA